MRHIEITAIDGSPVAGQALRKMQGKKKLTFKDHSSESDSKLEELILHIASKCERDRHFGATKLNKVLFFADFLNFQETGKPITGAEYFKLPQGPAPKRLLPVQKDMIRRGVLAIEERMRGTRLQKRPVPLREADASLFSGSEIKMVDHAIDVLCDSTATDVSNLSHGMLAWQIADDHESIPYESALLSTEPTTDFEIGKVQELNRRHAWE